MGRACSEQRCAGALCATARGAEFMRWSRLVFLFSFFFSLVRLSLRACAPVSLPFTRRVHFRARLLGGSRPPWGTGARVLRDLPPRALSLYAFSRDNGDSLCYIAYVTVPATRERKSSKGLARTYARTTVWQITTVYFILSTISQNNI